MIAVLARMETHHFSTIEDISEGLPEKTVDQEDLDLAYQEHWGNGSRLANIPVWRPPADDSNYCNVFHQFYCQRIVFIRRFNALALRFGGYDYEIDLRHIQTEHDLLFWVFHLSSKDWMTFERLRVFLKAVVRIKSFPKFWGKDGFVD